MPSSTLIKLLVNLPNLLIDVHPLSSFHFLALLELPIIVQRRFLPPRSLLFTDHRLSGHTIKDIASL